jgi:hypothetical protein
MMGAVAALVPSSAGHTQATSKQVSAIDPHFAIHIKNRCKALML